MWNVKWSRMIECLGKKQSIILIFCPCLLIFSLYFLSGKYLELDNFFPVKLYNPEDEIVDGYLVWNPKCHILSEKPMDPAIKKYIKKQKFESCSHYPLLTSIIKESSKNYSLVINNKVKKNYKTFVCCWIPIIRPEPENPPTGDWDSKIKVGNCKDFTDKVQLPVDLEIVKVSCRVKGKKKKKSQVLYENVHPIVNPFKVEDRMNSSNIQLAYNDDELSSKRKKMSILVLGIDSVSRLNFLRSLPKTEKYLRENKWFNLRGYNKMGDNTFPNLMAILTGQNSTTAYNNCKPKKPFGLDKCPFIWYKFRETGYITAYGEDIVPLSTFNYLKVGFVDPPTDYYLRPYIIATEKLLRSKNKFDSKYCTGPQLTFDRIFDYAGTFAKTFIGQPYFGFFWTNSVTHNDMNGISSMDSYLLNKFDEFDKAGIFNDSMVILLSDHGMRWGEIRNTFVGWYEERLPFIYVKIPEWFDNSGDVIQSLKINQHRLTSPYDLYETFRDILIQAGGNAISSSGCPKCHSLFKPVTSSRGCDDAGVSPHWCTCTVFNPENPNGKIAIEGAKTFLKYVENVVKIYKNKKGKRLCAKLMLKKIHRINKILNLNNFDNDLSNNTIEKYSYLIEVKPGGGLFETTIHFDKNGQSKMSEEEVSRINSYAKEGKCLDNGFKKYCHCLE